MSSPIDNSSPAERLLIVRLSAMGDVIHTLPAAQALREIFPNAMMGWLIEERWAELLCEPATPLRGARSPGRPLADWVHTINLKGWRKSLFSIRTAEQIARVWNDVRSVQYDLAIDLQGAVRSAVLARGSGAPIVWGGSQTRESPASLWYTRKAIIAGTHVVEQNLSIAEAVAGAKLKAPQIRFPRSEAAERLVEQRLGEMGIRDFAILNPGAGWGAKRWPSERYGEVARELAAFGVHSIVNYGPGEAELARDVEAASGGAARGLSCTITELIALTRKAGLFVGGDTGPLHLAAALGIPVVGIYGPTNPARNGPYGAPSIVLRNPASATSHARVPQPDESMLKITVESVVEAARTLLGGTDSAREGTRPAGAQSEATYG